MLIIPASFVWVILNYYPWISYVLIVVNLLTCIAYFIVLKMGRLRTGKSGEYYRGFPMYIGMSLALAIYLSYSFAPRPEKIQEAFEDFNTVAVQESFNNVTESYKDIKKVISDETKKIEVAVEELQTSIELKNKELSSVNKEVDKLRKEVNHYRTLSKIEKEEAEAINNALLRSKYLDVIISMVTGILAGIFVGYYFRRVTLRVKPNT